MIFDFEELKEIFSIEWNRVLDLGIIAVYCTGPWILDSTCCGRRIIKKSKLSVQKKVKSDDNLGASSHTVKQR